VNEAWTITEVGGIQAGSKWVTASVPDYRPNAFQYDEQCDEMICPEGRRLKPVSTQQRAGGLQIKIYGADRDDCRCCSKRQHCSPQNAMPKHGRTVSMRD